MCYHSARIEARISDEEDMILIENQDRNKWDKELINIGHFFYRKALQVSKFSIHHLEAAIAAQHILSENPDETNWERLVHLYRLLFEIKPFPSVRLNLVVALLKNEQLTIAKEYFVVLSEELFNPNPYLYHSVGAKLYEMMHNIRAAEWHLNNAIEYADHPAEKELLQKRLKELCS